MTSVTEPGIGWLKHREEFLDALEDREVSVKPPLFPVEECSRLLKEKFGKKTCSFSFEIKGRLSPQQALEGIGIHPLVQPLVMQPVSPGDFFFVSSEEDLREWIVSVFADNSLASYFYEKDKLLGFHYYFVAEMSHLLQNLQWVPSLSVKIADDARFSTAAIQTDCLVVDVSCSLDDKHFRFRLLFPVETVAGCETFFSGLNKAFDPEKINKRLPLTLSMEVGHCSLNRDEWRSVVPGAFIMLDSCMYDPDSGECGAIVSVQGKKFFGGKLASGEFKITGFSTITQQNEDGHMEGQPAEAPQPANPEGQNPGGSNEGKEALSNLPIHLVIEVARYTLTVEEFMKLAPGSTLNLGINPNQGVDLVVQGAKVGRGEIIALGDVLGVRVIDI